jgi:hypothetical protein
MRIGRGAVIAGVTAVIAVVGTSGGAVAHTHSSHSGRVHALNHAYGLAGTLAYSAHGSDQEDAATTVPPAGPDGGCTEPPKYLKVTDAYSFHGSYRGDLGASLIGTKPKASGHLLGLGGTAGCGGPGQGVNDAATSYACAGSPRASISTKAGPVHGRWELTVYSLVTSGPQRSSKGEPCADGVAPDLPNGSYLEVGGVISFSLHQLEKHRTLSFTFDSRKAKNCRATSFSDLSLPAHAQTCVDPANAKNGLCHVFPVPAGGSAACDVTSSWVEKVTFHLGQVCTTHFNDVLSRAESTVYGKCEE